MHKSHSASNAHPALHRRAAVRLLVLALLVGACAAPVSVKRAPPTAVHRTLTQSVLSTGKLSGPTEIVLHRQQLTQLFDEDPEQALMVLRQRALNSDTDQDLFALAEASFYHAVRTGRRPHFFAAAIYAYAFLFPDDPAARPQGIDPRYRLAFDLYNRAITQALESPDGEYVELQGGTYPLPWGWLDVSFNPDSLRWGHRRLVRLVPVAELQVRGLQNRYRIAGIGAPLAAATEPLDPDHPVDDFVGKKVRVPVTALLRIDDPRQQMRQDRVTSVLEVYAATDTEDVTIAGQTVPLEVEPTASLAMGLAESRLWEQELGTFLGAALGIERPTRLGALEPYQSGRMPVVFVHGTASSSARWADMVNDLESDPRIRQKYQFWFFTYDSGNPITYSSMLLRQSLTEAVAQMDPSGTDECLRRMVLIGHSQGGLLTKMTVINSGARFWDNVSSKPFEDLRVSDQTRTLLQNALFVTPLPPVQRVVFIATPHRGSYLAGPQLVRRLAARFIKLPSNLLAASSDLLLLRDQTSGYLNLERIPTSIDNMSPGNEFIKTLSQIPIAPGVAAHSIVAVQGDGPPEDGDDGVVRYASAHIEPVDSELIVRSSHSTQANPQTVNEVHRILLLHAAADPCTAPGAVRQEQ